MDIDTTMGDEVYQPDGSEVQDDSRPARRGGHSRRPGRCGSARCRLFAPERPWAVEHHGVTAAEQHEGETLDQRLSEEEPDLAVPDEDEIGDVLDTDGEVRDDEVGGLRAGRLVAPDEGAHEDDEKDMIAFDVGIDGAAASAEEAAMHVVPAPEGP